MVPGECVRTPIDLRGYVSDGGDGSHSAHNTTLFSAPLARAHHSPGRAVFSCNFLLVATAACLCARPSPRPDVGPGGGHSRPLLPQ